jgi:predicted acylesterase/phospholipase RssA
VLSGAGAKGAYHAGVLSRFTHVPITRIAGTSAGALNALVYAAGLATGRLELAVHKMKQLWVDDGSWRNTLSFSPRGVLCRQGLSTDEKISKLLFDAVEDILESDEPVLTAPNPDLEFRIVATDLEGFRQPDGVTTHERGFVFHGRDFEVTEKVYAMVRRAAASAAFPGLFTPVKISPAVNEERPRPYLDGGLCDNAPLSYVLEDDAISQVYVVTSSAGNPEPDKAVSRGTGMVADIVDILVNERLSRDIESTRKMNRRLGAVRAALAGPSKVEPGPYSSDSGGEHDAAVASRVLKALDLRHVEVVKVCPNVELVGNVLSGLFDKRLRRSYYEAGQRDAELALKGAW